MIASIDIPVKRITSSKLPNVNWDHLPFGHVFSDYMLEADYYDGEWRSVKITPYQALSFEPSMAALHYGQCIFEGIKAYKTADDNAVIFRPYDNFKRFNISAVRMDMPEVPEEIFMGGMQQLIALEKDWIPKKADHSLYIRPFMFATDNVIGVRTSATYKFLILLSPTGPYHAAPMRICVEETYTRAAVGGVGFTKNAGNYGGGMYPTALAKKKGFDQVLWTDAIEHKWLQEVGMMNVFFVVNNIAVTPSLDEGTILEGVTRTSAITVLHEMGYTVEERPVSIDELVAAHKKGEFQEAFGTGTAATVSPIKELCYKDYSMVFDVNKAPVATELKSRLDAIRGGKTEDIHGWLFKI